MVRPKHANTGGGVVVEEKDKIKSNPPRRILKMLISLRHTLFLYRGADKSLARPTSRCIFLMVRIFRLMLVLL